MSTPPGRLGLQRGRPQPLGATLAPDGVNFAVHAEHATGIALRLFAPGAETPAACWWLDAATHRTGAVWHAFVEGIGAGWEYCYRARRDGAADARLRYDSATDLIDPWASCVVGAEQWGGARDGGARIRPRRNRIGTRAFDWGEDRPPGHHLADSIIYELHVRCFTRHPSSGVAHPGTFRGLIEKIPHLRSLGVTAVELLPIAEFDENDNPRRDPTTGAALVNLWGYQPLSFLAPRSAYAALPVAAGQELKELVKALHAAGIEVLLDVVFNHTGEGDGVIGTSVSWRGLDRAAYYLLDPVTGADLDLAACGNTFRCHHPPAADLIVHALRFWVSEYRVDGFRFDLASILGLGERGEVLERPPLLERIAADPVLAGVKLIAEPWDAAGTVQVGTFPHFGRFAEWNSAFQDDVRRFVRGDADTVAPLATRLAGSADLYQRGGRSPWHSVQYVACHDGFTLADLVSHRRKHNLANGQENRDGRDDNLSFNCGVEGVTDDAEVLARRARAVRNLGAILLLAQGTPMLLAGDELGRSQGGNNNAWCQDNEVSWLDWSLLERNADLLRFFRNLIAFRRSHPALRRRSFVEPDGAAWATWQGSERGRADWSEGSRLLGLHLHRRPDDVDLFLVFSNGDEPIEVELPVLEAGRFWRRALDTAKDPPEDAVPVGRERELAAPDRYLVSARSVVALVAAG